MLTSDRIDVDAKNKEYVAVAEKKLAMYGYAIDSESCKSYVAYIGKDGSHFQWCKLHQVE